jgi:succinate dehydrogenase hydrophobic anchor subunit
VARSPYVLALEVILLAGILIHGLNGLRVALTGFGVAVKCLLGLYGVLMLVAIVALGAAALKIFGG